MLATVLHLHRGTPYVYQGEELGMTNAHFTRLDQYRDIETLRHVQEAGGSLAGVAEMGRDNARTPMQWSSEPHAGFTTGTPWIEVNENFRMINAAAERAEPDSVFHHYRRLIALRHDDPWCALGDFTMLLPDHEHVYAYTRALGDMTLTVLGNFSGEVQEVELDDNQGELILSNYAAPATTLRPWEARVHRRRGSATGVGRGPATQTLTCGDP